MSPRKSSARPSGGSTPPASTRFVRRRRSVKRRRSDQPTGGAQPYAPPERAPEHAEPLPAAQDVPLPLGPRTVDPPPRNPNVFSFTYTVWKGS